MFLVLFPGVGKQAFLILDKSNYEIEQKSRVFARVLDAKILASYWLTKLPAQ